MASIKTIEDIIRAFSLGGNKKVINVLEEEVKKQRENGKMIVAKRLSNLIKDVSNKHNLSGQSLISKNINMGDEMSLFQKTFSDVDLNTVVLNLDVKRNIIEFLKHWEFVDKLIENNINPINKLLFYGPPGTGKTKLACAIANQLQLPLIVINLAELISSYLGKTGKNISKVFDIAKNNKVVIFFDEIDTIAKHRDDTKELGELKRVVTVLLQNIDSFKGDSILIGATNHEKLLDKALWRRFEMKLEINLPDNKSRSLLFELFIGGVKNRNKLNYNLMAEVTKGMNGSFINDICLNIRRTSIIDDILINDILCLKHILSFNNQLKLKQKIEKKYLYQIARILKEKGFALVEISEISGIPYTTLRDNIK